MRHLLDSLRSSQSFGPALLATTVGVLAGVGAIVFRYLIDSVQWLFFEGTGKLTSGIGFLGLSESYIILVPAVGMVLVTWIIHRWAMEAKGHGVPEVQYAVKRKGGRIRPRIAAVKALASAISIGSGGSVGREGPIVQIGCSLGSTVGQVAGLRESGIQILVACGAAGAVGATFNAPIAGVMFALEVILGSFAARSFGLVVISSVTATAISRAFLGEEPAFQLQQLFALKSAWEYAFYLGLGAMAGVIALVYVRCVYASEDWFDRWQCRPTYKALLGGLAVGAIGFACFHFLGDTHVLGVGYESIQRALESDLAIHILLLLLVLKIVATSVTLGAGGSGGVFAPALFIGAMAGGALGLAVNWCFPSITAPAGAYALVGMAAMFAGAAHAPITSIIILFEMTDDYKIILPLMLAGVVSHLIASRLSPDSIYTIKLRRRGGFKPPRTEVTILDMVLVADAMSDEYQTVAPDLPLRDLEKLFRENLIRSCPVLDSDKRLVGIVTEFDVESAGVNGELENRAVGDIMVTNLITGTPEENLRSALGKFTNQDVNQILVVDSGDEQRLLGVLRRSEILWAYNELAVEHGRLLAKTGEGLPTASRDSVQVEIQVRNDHETLTYRKIRDIEMPDQCIIAILRRGEHAVIPRGGTVIEPGDFLVFLTTRTHERRLRNWVAGLTEGRGSR